jgi:hypothetical protein
MTKKSAQNHCIFSPVGLFPRCARAPHDNKWSLPGGNVVFITPMGHNKNEVPYEHGAPLGHSQVLSTFSAHLWATPLGHSQVLSTPLGHTSGPQAGSQHTSGPQAGSQHTSGPHPGSQHTSRPHLWHMGPHFYRGPVWLVGGMKTIPPPLQGGSIYCRADRGTKPSGVQRAVILKKWSVNYRILRISISKIGFFLDLLGQNRSNNDVPI